MAHCVAFAGIVRGVPGVPAPPRAARPRTRTARMPVRAGNNPFDATSGAAKRAADTVSDKAKSFWNDEVLGAKKAMERDASKKPGADVRATVDVTLEQSVLGAEVPLTYSRRCVCPTCGGAGRLPQTFIDCDTCEGNVGLVSEDVSVTVSVPKGVSNGATLRLRDQGDEGSPPGQLYVTVRAAAMSAGAAVARDGNDLISRDIVARFPKAGEPTSVRVRTIEGEWGNLTVPADAKVGQALRIKGRGAPVKPGADERGDHLFVIGKIVVQEPNEGVEEDA